MSDSTFETLLTRQLRAYAEAGIRPIDRYTIADETIASGHRRWFGQRLGGSVPGLPFAPRAAVLWLVLLVLAGGLLAIGASRLVQPPAPLLPYEAIFVRSTDPSGTVDIVAVRSDGQERLVRRLGAAGRSFQPFASVSPAGWLAVHVDADTWALIDLAQPEVEPRYVRYTPVIGGAWGPNGMFATTLPDVQQGFSIQVVDAATGASTTMPNLDLPGGGPDLIWAADGSGLLIRDGNGFAVAPVDNGAIVPGVPALAPRLMSRSIAKGGASLTACQPGACLESERGLVLITDAKGSIRTWYDREIDGASVLDASFAADGESIWLLLDRVTGSEHTAVIARADAPGQALVVSTVDLGEGVAHMWFNGLAPDDSSIAIGHWVGELGGDTIVGPVTFVPTAGGTTIAQPGNFIGFVSTAVVRSWP